jgi:hypothetical protein
LCFSVTASSSAWCTPTISRGGLSLLYPYRRKEPRAKRASCKARRTQPRYSPDEPSVAVSANLRAACRGFEPCAGLCPQGVPGAVPLAPSRSERERASRSREPTRAERPGTAGGQGPRRRASRGPGTPKRPCFKRLLRIVIPRPVVRGGHLADRCRHPSGGQPLRIAAGSPSHGNHTASVNTESSVSSLKLANRHS